MNIDTYRQQIDRLIWEKTGEIVLNGSHDHAAVIIERMLANAKADVAIMARRFDRRIYGTPETIKQANLYLEDPERRLEILVEEGDAATLSAHPFVVANAAALAAGNLKIGRITEPAAEIVDVNFSVMDDDGYRVETDGDKAIATAAFGATAFTAQLRTVFDTLWRLSTPLELVPVG